MRNFKNYDTLLFAAVGFFVIYLYTSYSGVGISPDSIMYTSAARSFVHNGTLITFNNAPIVDFPVFYPLFLGVISFITRTDPVVFGAVLNMFMFATLLYISGWIMSRFVPTSHVYKWLMLAAILLNPGLLQVYSYLWSETLFILEVLLFLITFRKYLLTHTVKWLIAAAAIAAIACITRYAAVTIVGTGGLLLLLDRKITIRKKIGHILIYGSVCISLLVGNLAFNALHTGTVTGPRQASLTPFIENLHYFGIVFCDWIGLTPNQYFLATPLAIIILTGFIIALVINYNRKKIDSYENMAITFALIYGLFIVLSSTFSRYERINPRLLAPMYIPALWGYTSWGLLLLKRISVKRIRTAVAVVFILLMLGYITKVFFIDKTRYDELIADEYGMPGYTDNDWMNSDIAKYLKQMDKNLFKPGVTIYSDAHEAVYFFSGLSAYLVPHKYIFKEELNKFNQRKQFYIIWFNNLENPEFININDIQKMKNIKLIKKLEDGAIYEYDGLDQNSQN